MVVYLKKVSWTSHWRYTFISPRTLLWISSYNPVVILFAVLGKSWQCCLPIANPSHFWSTSSLESKLSPLTISVFSKSFRLFYPWWLYRWCHNLSVFWFVYTESLVRNSCVQFLMLAVLMAAGVLLSINGHSTCFVFEFDSTSFFCNWRERK